jgi:hypothetical protein
MPSIRHVFLRLLSRQDMPSNKRSSCFYTPCVGSIKRGSRCYNRVPYLSSATIPIAEHPLSLRIVLRRFAAYFVGAFFECNDKHAASIIVEGASCIRVLPIQLCTRQPAVLSSCTFAFRLCLFVLDFLNCVVCTVAEVYCNMMLLCRMVIFF